MRWLARFIAVACLAVVVLSLLRCSSRDSEIEVARRRMLSLSPAEAASIVASCRSLPRTGLLLVSQFPALPATPTTIQSRDGVVIFAWWNNSHFEESVDHPGFEILCSPTSLRNDTQLAPGLYYRDTPQSSE